MSNETKTKKAIFIVLIAIVICGFILYGLMHKADTPAEPTVEDDTQLEPQPEQEPVCEIVEHNKVYLAIDEAYILDSEGYISQDNNIAKVEGNKVIGVGVGNVNLSNDCNSYEIEVTDMITAPYISEDKEQLPCGQYTIEENEYLDEVLASKIRNVGYKTRAGAVEAGRFLLLQFPYHMAYFSENGRLPYCEAEGRYYHEGLYLNTYKIEKEGITEIINGPAEWGCRIFSNPANCYQINSLDCSGFVTWCLVNGGFDPGDLGAGISEAYDYSDIGPRHEITMESLDEVKVGDLFGEDGHISILIGINDGKYYIAESNLGIDIRVRVSTKQELIDSNFYAWIDMEEFYNHQDGKLTDFWTLK